MLSLALLLSTAHGFVVTAGPRRSASMSRPRHDIVAAADYDKCRPSPPCRLRVHPLMFIRSCAHTVASLPPQDCRGRISPPFRLGLQVRRHHEGAHALPHCPRACVRACGPHSRMRSPAPGCAEVCMLTHRSVAPRHTPSGPDGEHRRGYAAGGGGCRDHDAAPQARGLCPHAPD